MNGTAIRTGRITIGYTRTNADTDYYPMTDGYQPGAEQDVTVADVPLDLLAGQSPEGIAEAVFIATNAPAPHEYGPLTAMLAEVPNLTTRRSLSVGDTVAFGDTRLACDRTGWVVA